MESTQLSSSERVITTNNGRIISATDDGASCSGRKDIMAISVAMSSAARGAVAAATTASAGFCQAGNGKNARFRLSLSLSLSQSVKS